MRGRRLRSSCVLRGFATASAPLNRRIIPRSHHASRPGLARLLAALLTDAGLQAIEPGWHTPPLKEQAKAIWAAARTVTLDAGVHLPEFLCTSPARLPELADKIAQTRPERFRHTRPHGVLIARIKAIGDGVLEPVSGEPIRILGRLAVFAEHPAGTRDTRAERAARAPYLAACLLGRPSPEGDVQVLAAYAHPCAAEAHLMLLDSDLERRTLAQLRSVQSWLARKKQIAVTIDKPLFDVGQDAAESDPRPPLLPDFLVRAQAEGDARIATVIVETMGFADQAYRGRKQHLHPAMSDALGAPVVLHDFHEPPARPQAWRDDRFWRELCRALLARGERRLMRSATAAKLRSEPAHAADV